MIRLILRKLVLMAIILVLLNYVAYHFAIRHPGNFYFPFSNIPNPDAAPIESQYPAYVQGVLRGDLGSVAGVTVMEIIREPVRNSLILLVTALAVTAAAGLVFGFIAILPRTWRIRPGALLFLTAGSSMPGFVFGAIVLALLMYQLLYAGSGVTLLPISGFGLDAHLILPVLVLSIQPTFHLAKVTAGLLESELQKDYIQVANSKGLTWSHIIRRHAWPNMLSPLLVTIGHALRLMVGALVIVEAVFLWPGVGRLALLAIGLRLDAGPSGNFFGNPNLIAILAVIMGSWLLIADLITAVLAYRLDHRVRVALETSGVTPA